MLTFQDGGLKGHSLLLGGKSRDIVIDIKRLGDMTDNVSFGDNAKVSVVFESIIFPPGTKATPWKKIEEMFKNSLTGGKPRPDWGKANVYARWRILELAPEEGGAPRLTLCLECLPLSTPLEQQKPEVMGKMQSSSSIAAPLAMLPCKWRSVNTKKSLYTTPSLVVKNMSTELFPTDGTIRMACATVRDTLRAGKLSTEKSEDQATVQAPDVARVWACCPRKLHMPVLSTFSMIEKEPAVTGLETPFAQLGEESMRRAMAQAEEALVRQRPGVDGVGWPAAGFAEPETAAAAQAAPAKDAAASLAKEKIYASVLGHNTSSTPSMNVSGSGVGAGLSAARDKGLTSTGGGWRFICEFEYCSRDWKTEVVPASEIATLVKLYELHTLQVHKTKEEESGEMFKEKEKYVEATKVRVIPAGEDNRLDKLRPARFLPLPLRYQDIAKNQPARQTPVWERLDLSHVGLHLADSTIIKKCHDRTYTGAQLKDFSGVNLGMDPCDKDLVFKPLHAGGMKQTRSLQRDFHHE